MRKSKPQIYGEYGERWAYDQLKNRGYPVNIIGDFFAPNRDLSVGHLSVEVKIAKVTWRKISKDRDTRYPRWQWTLHDTCEQFNQTGDEFILILLAELKHGRIVPFIVPGALACQGSRRHIQLTSHPDKYQGWLAAFKDRWELIGIMLQTNFFDDQPIKLLEEWGI